MAPKILAPMAAPAAQESKAAMAPKILKTERVRIDSISIEDDSGWRAIDPHRVSSLCNSFKDGEFGMGTLTIPSLRCDQDDTPMLGAHCGCYRISNGKSTVAALHQLFKEWEDAGQDENKVPWATGSLLETFQEGLRVDFLKFQDDDDDINTAWWALQHDEELLNLKKTSIKDKIRVYMIQLSKAQNDKSLAVKNLVDIYGIKKRSVIYQWQAAATAIPEEVVDFWEEKTKQMGNVPQGYVLGNKYIMSTGVEARLKLKPEYAKAALSLLFAKMEDEQGVSVKEFIGQYCAAMKIVEQWEAKVLKDYGKSAQTSLALQRVIRMLCTERGRGKVMEATRSRVPLHGVSGSDEHGIEECRNIITELAKLKAGSSSKTSQETAGADTGAGVTALGADGGAGVTALGTEGDPNAPEQSLAEDGTQDVSLLIGSEVVSRFDPVLEVARGLLTAEMAHINMHSSHDALKRDLSSRILSGHRVLFCVDAPTSRISVVVAQIKSLPALVSLTEKWSLMVTCGHRLDLLSTVGLNLQRHFPKLQRYVVQCAPGKVQSQRKVPSYVVYVSGPGCDADQVQSNVDLSRCNARAYEGLRFRCTDPACKYRSKNEDLSDNTNDVPEEDAEELDVSAYLAFEEDDAEVEKDMEVDAALAAEEDPLMAESEEAQAVARQMKKQADVFTFAFPIEWYRRILRQVTFNAQHLVILTRTSHPGLVLAGRGLQLEVTCLVQGPNKHSMGHGQAVLESICLKMKWDDAKKSSKAQGVKRVRSSGLQFIETMAPKVAEQLIRVSEVDLSMQAHWRSGLNNQVENLQDKITTLVAKELDTNDLAFMGSKEGRSLITLKPLREGDTICVARALWYDSLPMLEEMLSSGDNSCLRDRLIRIDGLAMSGNDDKVTASAYGILVGACRHVQHYGGRRKAGPNAALVVDTTAGYSDGLLKLVVKTRNQIGIASKGAIYINFGSHYVHDDEAETKDDGVEAKRFRGALDVWLKKREETDAASICADVDMKAETKQVDEKTDEASTQKQDDKVDEPKDPKDTDSDAAKGSHDKPWAGKGLEVACGGEDAPWGACVFQAPQGSDKGCVRLYASPKHTTNKKVPPHSVLVVIREGKLGSMKGNLGLPFDFKDPKKDQVYVVTNSKTRAVDGPRPLAKWVQELGLKSIQNHGSVAPTLPKNLKAQSSLSFVPEKKEMQDFLQHCINLGSINVAWVMKNQDGVFLPWGILVATSKLVIIPAKGSIEML